MTEKIDWDYETFDFFNNTRIVSSIILTRMDFLLKEKNVKNNLNYSFCDDIKILRRIWLGIFNDIEKKFTERLCEINEKIGEKNVRSLKHKSNQQG
jgi:hypothetical protein